VINLQALFSLAERSGRILSNPTSHLTYQKKTGERGRLTEAERFAIYDAACRETNPLFKWAPLFGLFHGVGPAEICEADSRDLVFEQGIPVMMIQTDHRKGDERTLKSAARKRGLPIHSAIRDQFVRYVQSLPPGPLFHGLKPYEGRRARDGSNKLNDWLRDVAGVAKGKSFYWMRHTVKSTYESKWLPDRLNDYLLGHSVQAVAAVYLHREIKELIAAIELVTLPVRAMDVVA
jgi:integrase